MLYLRAHIRAVCVRSNTLSPVEQNVFSHANIIGGFTLTYNDSLTYNRNGRTATNVTGTNY